MKFNLNDFMQLDTKALLAVNGGTHCGGETGNYYGNSYSASSSSESWGGGSSYGGSHGSNGGGAGGGGCSRFDLSAFANKTGVNNRTETSTSVGGGGGSCSGKSESLKTCPTDKVTTYSDGRIQVSHKDGSHDFYYSDGRHIYYPSGKTEEISENSQKDSDKGTTAINESRMGIGGGSCSGKNDSVTTKNSTDSSIDGCSRTSGSSSPQTGTSSGASQTNSPKKSGKFGQITDGSYADKLTMHYYKSWGTVDGTVTNSVMNNTKNANGEVIDENIFSKDGCLMTAVAKVLSEKTGKNITPLDVNNKVDTNSDGLLSFDEISKGLNNILDSSLGDIYDVKSKNIDKVTLKDLELIASDDNVKSTYVLGYAPKCHGGHWVVLEGYGTDSKGQVYFNYDGTSFNDSGRSFILGLENQNDKKNIFGITRVETFSIIKK